MVFTRTIIAHSQLLSANTQMPGPLEICFTELGFFGMLFVFNSVLCQSSLSTLGISWTSLASLAQESREGRARLSATSSTTTWQGECRGVQEA